MIVFLAMSVTPAVFADIDIAPGISVGLNLIAFNVLVVLSASSIVDQLHVSFLKERQLQLLYRQSEQEIKNLNLNLEQKIEERTTQLVEINDRLLNEIEEHRKTEEDFRMAELLKTDHYSLNAVILSPTLIFPSFKTRQLNPPCPRIALYPPLPRFFSMRLQGWQ
jgi:hypothetical protein